MRIYLAYPEHSAEVPKVRRVCGVDDGAGSLAPGQCPVGTIPFAHLKHIPSWSRLAPDDPVAHEKTTGKTATAAMRH